MDDPALNYNLYVVQRDFGSLLSLSLDFMDKDGNKVLQTRGKVMVQRQTLETPDGKVLSTVTHKIFSMMPCYQIHEGDQNGPVMGVVQEKLTLGSLAGVQTLNIRDESNNVIAIVKGDFMNFNFSITAPDGAQIADVTRTIGGEGKGVMQALKDVAKRKYTMQITNKGDVKTSMLLGFLMVLELLANQSKNHSSGFGTSFGPKL